MTASADWKNAPAPLKRAHEQLQCLYEVSKRLTRFRTIAETVPQILALVSGSVPVLTAILILEDQGPSKQRRTRAISWHTREITASRLHTAKANAIETYTYLAHRTARVDEEAAAERIPSAFPPPLEPAQGKFLFLPLVIHHGPIFGALQIESRARLEETDLMFINAMVGQLAIALDRVALAESKQKADEAALLSAEFLAAASMILFSSLDYQTTIATVVRAAVPPLADICFIDEISHDGRVDRIALAVAEPDGQDLADQMRHFAPATDPETPQAAVLRTGKSVLLSDFHSLTRTRESSTVFDELSVPAMMSVPLTAGDRKFGVLTFLSLRAGYRYSESELTLAEEVGRRAAIAMDNARLYEQARRATQARDDLLATVSHDLRNPLGSISMSISVLQRASPPELRGDQARKAIATIDRSTERMARLIGDLLDIAAIEAGRLTVDRKTHEVAPMIEESMDSHQSAAAAKALRLESDLRATGAVECDRERILEVLDNLLSNAIKFTPRGGAIKVTSDQRGEQVLFSVADTGTGLSADELAHVFDRFWQAKNTAHLGNGLGLPIAKGLVEANGGSLWVESTFGQGSTFFFTLPASRVERRPASSSRWKIEGAAPTKTLLLVDDDADIRDASTQLLEREGYRVVLAANGVEALDYLLYADEAPFLILLDLRMPVMDGWTFLAERSRHPALESIPIIIISAQRGVDTAVLSANAIYLEKPVKIDRLVKTIARLAQ